VSGTPDLRMTLRQWLRVNALQVAVALSVSLALIVPGSIIAVLETTRAEERARTELTLDLERAADVLAASLSTPLWELSVPGGESIVRAMSLDERIVSIVVTENDSQRIFVQLYRMAGNTLDVLATQRKVLREGQQIGTVDISMTLAPYLEATRARTRNSLLLLFAALLFALSGIFWVLRIRLLAPIRALAAEAYRIADENLGNPIVFAGNNELGRVAEAMESMRVRLLSSFDELQERTRRAQMITEASPVPLVMVNEQNEIMFINKAFIQTFGYPLKSIATLAALRSQAFPDPAYRQWFEELWDTRMEEALQMGQAFVPIEAKVCCRDGVERTVILSVSAVDDQRVGNRLIVFYDITERKEAEEQINTLAFFDQLTGLANRTLLIDRLRQAMAASSRSQQWGAVLFIDLDNFKILNDTLGHEVGDQLLKQIALRLRPCVREDDTVARFGGDEFVVMLNGLGENPDDAAARAEAIAEKVLAVLGQPYQLDKVAHRSTASIGISLFLGHATCTEDLLKQADLAMYRAKDAGRNILRFYDPNMEAALVWRTALDAHLRSALTESQFHLHYQPQMSNDGRILGAEALLRWQHPERGSVSPAEFIPAAEESGLIIPLGHWVLETACTQLASWAARPELAQLVLAVNVSARQFHEKNFVDSVLEIIARTGTNPRRLKLELTESLLVSNVEETIQKMFTLKGSGIRFALDDFGTGYSSLSYLKRLPLDQLKIDQSFVRDILVDPNDAAIANTIVALGNSLGLGVIAEGVETEAQREFLVGCGCHAYQGYLFSRPLPADAFTQFAAAH
jgi:diguanylate cyclase (GGDEF)-like protein/PAS domain S-box-containing protein